MALQKGMVSSKSNEWATPQWIFNELNTEFNFTLDPCSTKENHKCEKFYTINEDGLKQDWMGQRVFMNPPYGGHTLKWIKKAYEESKRGAIVVCLIVSATDRSYWHDIIFPFAEQIRFIRGRLNFDEHKSTAPFSSAIIVFGKKYEHKLVYYSKSASRRKRELNQTTLWKPEENYKKQIMSEMDLK
jgi:phage N-6-adenine-methyltransferase